MFAIMIEQGAICDSFRFHCHFCVHERVTVGVVNVMLALVPGVEIPSLSLFHGYNRPLMPSCRYLFTTLLYSQDIIRRTESHQQALIALLNEHSSLFGLKVKVLNRDGEEFPGGWHYHHSGMSSMIRDMVSGKARPYIFHMSWTNNKVNKIKFFQQMGDWYVNEKCIAKSVQEIGNDKLSTGMNDMTSPLRPECCLVEPMVICHYRDKPSIKPCRDSPPIDKGRPSWWKQ